MAEVFRFPNPVNEVAVRTTAGFVLVLSCVAASTGAGWVYGFIAVGFLLRAAAGPRLDPIALVVTRVIVPHLNIEQRLTPGPPKRFAQSMGAVFTLAAFSCALAGLGLAAALLILVVAALATLESVFGFCAGCRMFSILMRVGAIPESVCEECANLPVRWQATAG